MKKLLSVIIALAMVLSLFAAALADTTETQLVSDPARTDVRESLNQGDLAGEPVEEPAAEPAAEPAEEPAEKPAEAEGYLAYIMYADSSWANQYWGTDDSAVRAENVYVTGAGDYTVSLDFTGAEGGKAEGLAFMALGLNDAETGKKLYLKINEILVNGEAVEVGKGYTSSDDGIVTRMNIYNEWVAELPADARSYDGDLEGASPIIVDKAAFESVDNVTVNFTVYENMIDTAYIMYADSAWAAQYWGGEAAEPVTAKNALITGYGDYTVGLEFSGDGAQGLAFAALGITKGETTFKGATLKINAIRVNGEAIEFGKGYTSSDDGVTTRMNVYNEWVSALPEDARSYDGDLTDCNWIIVDKEAFASVNSVEIDFSLLPVTDTAYIMFADTNWTVQYWGSDDGSGVVATNAVVDGEGTYTVALDFTGTALGAASGTAFAAVGIVSGEKTFPGWFINVKDVKVNGESIEVGKGYTCSDDGLTTRVNLYNEWVSEVPADARVKDGDLEGVSPVIVDKAAFDVVETIEVTFDFIYGEAPAAAETALTEDEANAMLAADYNAYIGLQCKDNYTFRNAWNDSYGLNDENNPGFFGRLTGWEGSDAVDYGGTFVDAALTSSGTYTVSVTLGEMGLGATDAFNLLFVSTDIPSALVNEGYLTISDVKTKIGAQSTKEYTEVDASGDYVLIKVLDTYNQASEPFGYTMPQAGETITITFTVEGLTD